MSLRYLAKYERLVFFRLTVRWMQVSEYQLSVVARDAGTPRRSATMTTVVKVIDANDHAPRFEERQYEWAVPEDAAVGTVIGRVRAADDDAGHNAVVTYSFSRRTQVAQPHLRLHTFPLYSRRTQQKRNLVVSCLVNLYANLYFNHEW